jgi:hypothetical protein
VERTLNEAELQTPDVTITYRGAWVDSRYAGVRVRLAGWVNFRVDLGDCVWVIARALDERGRTVMTKSILLRDTGHFDFTMDFGLDRACAAATRRISVTAERS